MVGYPANKTIRLYIYIDIYYRTFVLCKPRETPHAGRLSENLNDFLIEYRKKNELNNNIIMRARICAIISSSKQFRVNRRVLYYLKNHVPNAGRGNKKSKQIKKKEKEYRCLGPVVKTRRWPAPPRPVFFDALIVCRKKLYPVRILKMSIINNFINNVKKEKQKPLTLPPEPF